MGKDSPVQIRPTQHAATAHLQMDQIPRLLSQGPAALEIEWRVEFAVGRFVRRLDWSKVDAHNKRFGVLVGNVNRPDPSPASQVQESTVLRVRGIDQPVRNARHGEEFVEDVQAILLLLVARQLVDSSAIRMVGASVLFMERLSLGAPVDAKKTNQGSHISRPIIPSLVILIGTVAGGNGKWGTRSQGKTVRKSERNTCYK